jgi:formylglycine-generating enzyme required for sulfatase activity
MFNGPTYPVNGASFDDVQAWLGTIKDGIRLPSEAEWEYACRAGTTTYYWWGDTLDGRRCWHIKNSGKKLHAVTEHLKARNAFGLADMLGNQYEFVADDFFKDYSTGPIDERPRTGSAIRVMRGGGFLSDESFANSPNRKAWGAGDKRPTIGSLGFRVAVSIPD